MAKERPKAAADIELQLSERRFILEIVADSSAAVTGSPGYSWRLVLHITNESRYGSAK